MKTLRHSLFLVLCAICTHVYAQEADQRCGFDALLQAQLDARGMTIEDIETQAQSYMTQYERFQVGEDNTIYKIPVVFHVMHHGEVEGVGNNTSTEKIHEQIRITNDDLRRRNANTDIEPPEFQMLGVDVGIELVLATTDPDGLPTDGIRRVEVPMEKRNSSPTGYVATLSKWPEEDYFNIWIVPLSTGLLGLATPPFFPDARVGDLNRSYIGNRPTHFVDDPFVPGTYFSNRFQGVYVATFSVGTQMGPNDGRFEGATLTHEVGHFLDCIIHGGGEMEAARLMISVRIRPIPTDLI